MMTPIVARMGGCVRQQGFPRRLRLEIPPLLMTQEVKLLQRHP
jgi:hypothetical protein